MLLASVSFLYPYGRDQAAFAYMAREWGAGRVPFLAAFEIKPPSIYLTYLVAVRLFGEGAHAIRVLDYVATVIPTAVACAFISAPRDEAPPAGRLGISLATATLVYYLPFDFWNTAQCESFCSAWSIVAAACAVRAKRPLSAGFLVGLCSTLAVSYKPTVALVAIANALLLTLALRSRAATPKDYAKAACSMLAGIALPLVVLFAYFGAKGAIPAMNEALVVTNRQYVIAGKYVHGLEETARAFLFGIYFWQALLLAPLAILLFRGVPTMFRRPISTSLPYFAVALGLASSIASVVVQLKFFLYHWGVVTGFVTLTLVVGLGDLGRALSKRNRLFWIPVSLVLGLLVTAGRDVSRLLYTAKTIVYAKTTGDDEPLARSFAIPAYFSNFDSRETGRWIAAHAKPGDTLVVRGFEPQIYMISGLRYGGRFFATTWLTQKQFSTRTGLNAAEDYHFFRLSPPRWVVAFTHVSEGVDAVATYEKLGYVPRTTIAVFTVLERGEPLTLPEASPW